MTQALMCLCLAQARTEGDLADKLATSHLETYGHVMQHSYL